MKAGRAEEQGEQKNTRDSSATGQHTTPERQDGAQPPTDKAKSNDSATGSRAAASGQSQETARQGAARPQADKAKSSDSTAGSRAAAGGQRQEQRQHGREPRSRGRTETRAATRTRAATARQGVAQPRADRDKSSDSTAGRHAAAAEQRNEQRQRIGTPHSRSRTTQ